MTQDLAVFGNDTLIEATKLNHLGIPQSRDKRLDWIMHSQRSWDFVLQTLNAIMAAHQLPGFTGLPGDEVFEGEVMELSVTGPAVAKVKELLQQTFQLDRHKDGGQPYLWIGGGTQGGQEWLAAKIEYDREGQLPPAAFIKALAIAAEDTMAQVAELAGNFPNPFEALVAAFPISAVVVKPI